MATTTYGRLVKPVLLNDEEVTRGRIISTHYLVRENGSWKIASVSQQSLRLFLTEYPDAAALFSQTHTRFELFSRGKWVRMPGSR
ncbi:MAG: hypothetical protein EBZ36_06865 [Acidobacteria bacterium]|nr:hypothetical protein [Acidobacteriota bacterium]